MVLEVTARNERGEEIFSDDHEYEMIGFDQVGKRAFDAWVIRKIDDKNTIHTDRIETKKFEIPIPDGMSSVSLESTLFYLIAPEAQPITMSKATKAIRIKE